jgi:hypothetical protein
MSHDYISTRYTDLRISTTARSGASAPDFANVNSTGIYAYQFTSPTHELHFSVQLPHGWDKGILKPHVHWCNSANWTSGTVEWTMDYVVTKPNGDTVFSGKQTITATGGTSGTAYGSHVAAFPDIDLTNIGGIDYTSISTLMFVRLSRSANTMDAGNPFLIEFDMHYGIRSPGTINTNIEP